MRRLAILHTEYSDGWGGQEMRIVAEARGIAARGHRVIIAARPQCQILTHAGAAGLATFALPIRANVDVAAIARLRRLIRTERIDIVNTHSSIDAWAGGIAAQLAAVRLVRTRHVSKRVRRHLLNFVHTLPDVTITTGAALRLQFLSDTGIAAQRVVSIPTGVDVGRFQPQTDGVTLRQKLGVAGETKIIVNVGVLRRAKRQVLLVDALARLPSNAGTALPHLVIAGAGSQRTAIEQRAAELGLAARVHLLGHVDDVRWVLAGADVVASASSGMEGVPQALVQALAMAKPVVATDDGAVGEVIRDGDTGVLVPPEDIDRLSAAIAELLAAPDGAASYGARGHALVSASYSYEGMLDAVERVYAQLCSCRRQTATVR